MNDQKPEKIEKPEELILAKQLIDDCKLAEADQLIRNFEEKGGHTLHDIVSCHLLKCELLLWQGLYEDLVKLAEQTYKESLGLGKNILSIDILLIMANSLVYLHKFNEAINIIKQAGDLLDTLTQESSIDYKQRKAYLSYVNGWYYTYRNDADSAIKNFEHSLTLREEIGSKKEIAQSLSGIALALGKVKGELVQAIKYAERAFATAKESNNKWSTAWSLQVMAGLYGNKGEIEKAINFYEQSLALYKEINSKRYMSLVLNNIVEVYRQLGELDRALECIEQSIVLNRELDNLKIVANNHDYLIQILIEKGELERAQQSFHNLEQLNKQLKDKKVNVTYLFDKALLLKTSSRTRNRAEAEEILKQILEEEDLDYELILKALLSLCELLLIELRLTNDLEVLDELNQFIARLLDIAKKSHSYWILCETLLIQAKLSLLTFNIKHAQRFLTQAQQIAERFGLNNLATKISDEQEDLLKKSDLWEKLEEINAPMSDRLELARLDEQIEGIVKNRMILTSQITEEKVAISKEKKICLVCRGEVFGFSYACKCGANYCENCARALINLENVCWACDVSIDYSKPSKPYKEDAERIKVQEKAKKK